MNTFFERRLVFLNERGVDVVVPQTTEWKGQEAFDASCDISNTACKNLKDEMVNTMLTTLDSLPDDGEAFVRSLGAPYLAKDGGVNWNLFSANVDNVTEQARILTAFDAFQKNGVSSVPKPSATAFLPFAEEEALQTPLQFIESFIAQKKQAGQWNIEEGKSLGTYFSLYPDQYDEFAKGLRSTGASDEDIAGFDPKKRIDPSTSYYSYGTENNSNESAPVLNSERQPMGTVEKPSIPTEKNLLQEFQQIGLIKTLKKYKEYFDRQDFQSTIKEAMQRWNSNGLYLESNDIIFQKDGSIKIVFDNVVNGKRIDAGYGILKNIKNELQFQIFNRHGERNTNTNALQNIKSILSGKLQTVKTTELPIATPQEEAAAKIRTDIFEKKNTIKKLELENRELQGIIDHLRTLKNPAKDTSDKILEHTDKIQSNTAKIEELKKDLEKL